MAHNAKEAVVGNSEQARESARDTSECGVIPHLPVISVRDAILYLRSAVRCMNKKAQTIGIDTSKEFHSIISC